MTLATAPPLLQEPAPAGRVQPATSWLAAAGLASLGAGAVHAAAAGAHGDHRAAALVFTALAAAQLLWGGAALVRRDRLVAALGVLVGAGSVAGWALAKTVGVPLVDGLDVVEPVGLADASAAVLAAVSTLLAGLALSRSGCGARRPGVEVITPADRSSTDRALLRARAGCLT